MAAQDPDQFEACPATHGLPEIRQSSTANISRLVREHRAR